MKKEIGFIGLGKMGAKANCFAFGGFAAFASGERIMQIQGLFWETAESKSFSKTGSLERVTRIELAYLAWEANTLPLCYTRTVKNSICSEPPQWIPPSAFLLLCLFKFYRYCFWRQNRNNLLALFLI